MTSTVQKLEEKLKKCYGEKKCVVSGNKRKGNILMAVHCHCRRLFRNIAEIFRDIALLPREEINRVERFPLPNNLKIEDIKRGEVTVPESVTIFLQNFIGGPDVRGWESNLKKVRTKSMSICLHML